MWLFYEDFNNRMPELERPPIPWCPELDSPDWHASYGEFEFNAGHNEVFENAIDPGRGGGGRKEGRRRKEGGKEEGRKKEGS